MENKVTQSNNAMAKAILYVCMGCNTSTNKGLEEEIETCKSKVEEKGIYEVVDCYKDNSLYDNLIERESLQELKDKLQTQGCQYLIVPTEETLGGRLSTKADAVKAFKEIGVDIYITDKDIDTATYAEQQPSIPWREFMKAIVGLDKKVRGLEDTIFELETSMA